MAKNKHMGHGKMGKSAQQGGGNLKLPSPSQSPHVMQQKDKMAGNVGGSAHMQPSSKALGYQNIQESSGAMKGVKSKREKY